MASFAEIELILKDGKYRSALKSVRSSLKELQSTLVAVGRQARNLLLVGGAALAFFVKTASDFEETSSKFDAVFKDQSDTVRLWVDDLAKSLSRSEVDLLAYMARLQDTFVPMGFARDEATKMSKELTQLGIDLASFNNIADDEAINALTSALVGNHEAVRLFGISITAASLDVELLALGFPKVTKGASAQEKALARLGLMLKATSDAQGDALRTVESFENQMKGLLAAVKTISQAIGDVFIPNLKKLIQVIVPWLQQQAMWVEKNQELIFSITAITASIAGVLVILPGMTALVIGATIAFEGLAIAVLFLAANPLVALTAAVAAAVLTVISLSKHIANLEQQMLSYGKEIDAQIVQLEKWQEASKSLQDVLDEDDFSDAGVLRLHEAYKKAHIEATKYVKAMREAGNISGAGFENAVTRMNDLERAVRLTGNQVDVIKGRQKEAATAAKELATKEQILADKVDKATAAMKLKAETFGFTSAAVQKHKLIMEGATEAELLQYSSYVAQVAILKKLEQKKKDAAKADKSQQTKADSLIQSLKTQEQLNAERRKENQLLFDQGRITEDQLVKANELLKIKKEEHALSFQSFQAAINRIQGASFRRDKSFQDQSKSTQAKKTPTTTAVEKQTEEIKIVGTFVKEIGQGIIDAFNPVGLFG